MTKHLLIAALCGSTALASPAWAQQAPTPAAAPTEQPSGMEGAPQSTAGDQEVEVSGPGADVGSDIVVTGSRRRNVAREAPSVVSVLSAADIARTGEGDVAAALGRVTGLSVVGGRFVYVRGLGERYSQALLNGSPLPSPEPLRRVVPLDLFPTSILASTVVQKSFSANYPGEFGGGTINLTTRSAPEEGFLDIGGSIGGDSVTTFERGYTYYGSPSDWTGFDSGRRDIPGPLAAAIASGKRLVIGQDFTRQQVVDITTSLDNAGTSLIQRSRDIPMNWSASLAAGDSWDLGEGTTLGVVVTGGLDNGWRTRGGRQQAGTRSGTPGSANEALLASSDFRYLTTENRIVANVMGAMGLRVDRHRFRLTGLFIRDSLKEARGAAGNNFDTVSQSAVRPDATLQTGNTGWYERQLIDGQAVAELRFGDLSLDLRGSWAKSSRDAPYERSYSYAFSDTIGDYVNDLRSPGQSAGLSFSTLDDTLWSGAVDLAYRLPFETEVTLSAGYAYTDNDRNAVRRDFEFFPLGALPAAVAQQRIDYLLSDVNAQVWNVLLRETTGGLGSAAYDATLVTHAGYVMADVEFSDAVKLNVGVRYEDGDQSVTPTALFGQPALGATRLQRSYWLPGVTLTLSPRDDMQVRLAASKTIARPQFRELAPQPYRDTESQRTFFGNPFLTDSTLWNAEARWEWYFGRDQQLSVAGFFKHIDNPIEATAVNLGSSLITSFANAPRARLWGGEVELRRYIPLESLGGEGSFWSSRRLAVIGNYAFTDSRISVNPGDTTISFTSQPAPIAANLVFDTTQRLRLTGQSRHLVNLQLSLEDEDTLSQQALLLTYASPRATQRGPNLTPDFIETPGVRLDLVLRQGVPVGDNMLELKFEARNLLGTDYRETQRLNGSELIINQYRIGTSFSLGATMKF